MSYLYEEKSQMEYTIKFKLEDLLELRDILGIYIEDRGEKLGNIISSMMEDYTNSMNLSTYMGETVKAIQIYKQIRKTLAGISAESKVCPSEVKKDKS